MFKKKKTYIILALVILIVGSIWYAKTKKPVTKYDTQVAEQGTLQRTVSVTGEISAPEEVELAFKSSGWIDKLLVKVGDRVVKDQKIVSQERGALSSRLAQVELAAAIQRKKILEMEKHYKTYDYFQREAQAKVVQQAEEVTREIVKQINDTVLYAPISGTVIRKNYEVGEMASANMAVVTIAADGDLEIEADVAESDIVEVKLGQRAEVTLDALSSEEILGAEVVEIEPAATIISDVVYYKVKLKLDQQDARLKIGMSADADIDIFTKDDVVMIPWRAVKNEGGQDYVEILEADNQTVRRVEIKTGLRGDDGLMEVVSGLKGGENVIILAEEK